MQVVEICQNELRGPAANDTSFDGRLFERQTVSREYDILDEIEVFDAGPGFNCGCVE